MMADNHGSVLDSETGGFMISVAALLSGWVVVTGGETGPATEIMLLAILTWALGIVLLINGVRLR